jgi:hypothetical protein
VADQNPSWNFKPLAGVSLAVPSAQMPRYPIAGHHLRPIYVKGMKGIVHMEVQAALERRAIHYDVELYIFVMAALDQALGRIFDLYYGRVRSEPHDEQLKRFIEVTVVDLLQSISTELVDAYEHIGHIAANALSEEDLPGFFERLLRGY